MKRFIWGTGRHVDFEEEVVSSTEKKSRGGSWEFSQSQAKVGREKDGSDFSDLTLEGKGKSRKKEK